MPCYDPQPNYRDNKAVLVAELLDYATNFLNIPRNKYAKIILEEYKVQFYIGASQFLDYVTKDLCFLLNNLKLKPDIFEKLVYNPYSKESRDLATWWEEHNKFDESKK